MNLKKQKIILFDGHCNLCNGSVQFIIKYDKKKIFKFTSLQSEAGRKLTTGIKELPDSIVFIDAGLVYMRSDATLRIADDIGGFFKLLLVFRILPKPLLDRLYDFIARKRYKWFGRKETCMVPDPELLERFL